LQFKLVLQFHMLNKVQWLCIPCTKSICDGDEDHQWRQSESKSGNLVTSYTDLDKRMYHRHQNSRHRRCCPCWFHKSYFRYCRKGLDHTRARRDQWYNPYMVPNDHRSWTRSTSCDLWDHPWRWTWSRSGSLQFGRILFGKIWSPLHRDSKRLQHCPMWLGKYHLQMGKVDLVSVLRSMKKMRREPILRTTKTSWLLEPQIKKWGVGRDKSSQ